MRVILPDQSEWPEETTPPPGEMGPPPPSPSPPQEPSPPIGQDPYPSPPEKAQAKTSPKTIDPSPVGTLPEPKHAPANLFVDTKVPIDERDTSEDEPIFPWFTVAPKIGYLYFPRSTQTIEGLNLSVDSRKGLIAKAHFDVGGDGLSLEIAPFFAAEYGAEATVSRGIPAKDSGSSQEVAHTGAMMAVGGQIMVTYKFNAGNFFPSIGIGLHSDYLMGSEIEYGVELYGRIPVGFSLYTGKNVAITMEFGLMYGVTGIRTPFEIPEELEFITDEMHPDTLAEFEAASSPSDYENWYDDHEEELELLIEQHQGELPPEYADYDSEDMMDDLIRDLAARSIRFGRGFGLDICFGLRFP